MELKKLMEKLHPLERKVLPCLAQCNDVSSIRKATGMQEVEVLRALQWLQSKKILDIQETTADKVVLGPNGQKYLKQGMPERKLLSALSAKPLTFDQALSKAGLSREELNVCIGLLRSKAAIILIQEKELVLKITDQGKKILEKDMPEEEFLKIDFPADLSILKDEMKLAFYNLKRRKQIIAVNPVKLKAVKLTELGKQLLASGPVTSVGEDRLTAEMLKSGTWKNKSFRAYDLSVPASMIFGGKRHFVNQAISYIRKIWLELGFKEMTGNMIQTSFWDLDALFVPQDHPARAMQDTFYLKNPSEGKLPAAELVKRVKAAHENGWTTGSLGWQEPWSEAKAKENMLRTHTTVLSAQTIAKLTKEELPAKFFSIGKVFRNEALDASHLFEFYQVEGIVIGKNVNFKHLKGYLTDFFKKMGYEKIRLRPAHFPYTEPSVEVDAFNPVTGRWIELVGAGIFRPEMTKPLFGEEVSVLAWGMGLERIITSYFGITDLRELYNNDIKKLREIKAWMK